MKSKKAVTLIALSIVSIFATAMELGFRAFLFKEFGTHSIIAGALPNFIAVLLISLIFKVIKGEKVDATPLKVSLMGTVVMIFYEFAQTFIPGRTFDWLDIAASIIGGLFAFLLLSGIDCYINNFDEAYGSQKQS